MKKFKILFILGSLSGGGAQRVILNIIRYINKERFIPYLSLFNFEGDFIGYLPDDIIIYDLKTKRARYSFYRLAKLINIVKPDIVFSSLPYVDEIVCAALKLSKYSPKTIFRSSNFITKSLKQEQKAVRLLAPWSYRSSDKIIASTKAMKKDFQGFLKIPSDKIKVIPNPIDLKMINSLSNECIKECNFFDITLQNLPIIISVGSLEDQKGYTYLIKAFSLVLRDIPAKLVILGKGKKQKELNGLAKDLKIINNIYFPGFVNNPFKYIKESDIFVLSSLWEGFPNAIIEAMACGTPVVSTNCPSGPDEIITPGFDGLLVPPADAEALAEEILRILNDRKLASKLSKNARDRVKDFDAKKIVIEYERLFLSV